jgi:hypothetical protein
MRKRFDTIYFAFAINLLRTLAEASEYRHMTTNDVLEINLSPRIFFIADNNGWAADVLEA